MKAVDAPLLDTDNKVTVYEQWPGCRRDSGPYWTSYTCTRRGQVVSKVYIAKFLEVVT